ncbi:MAG: homoserine dehydrogenase [Bacteroidia bacterium]|nr:homoserine dehydrogenase [Bacteroidia bacterium]
MSTNSLKIGLFGFGVVGEGIYQVLDQKTQLGVEVKKVVIRDPGKPRNAPANLFTTDKNEVLDDGDIELVVELIDDADAAYEIVRSALLLGKSVISANKKMIAKHHKELIDISTEKGVSLLYEGAVCGSVPIIRNLEEYFDNDLLTQVQGIVNGSTNYILSQMFINEQPYIEALRQAQSKGFAERDPSLDVEGFDAVYKLQIICLHAFGKHVEASQVLRKGITGLHPFDFQYAREKSWIIKLIARCDTDEESRLSRLSVLPTFVEQNNALGLTENEYNGVLIGSTLADEQFFHGKGAGRYPTSSAVLSDISAYRYGYKYEFKKGLSQAQISGVQSPQVYVGFDVTTPIDDSVFDEVKESFKGSERGYVIGTVNENNLRKTGWLENDKVSVIAVHLN